MARGQQASTNELNNAIQQNNQQVQHQNTGVDPYRRAQAYLKAMAPAISEALPKSNGMSAERLSRITLTTIKQNPKLLECSIESLLGAVLQSAQLGLEPNLMGSCYFIPFKGQVSFQIGYRGLIDLACRKGEVTSIVAQEVRRGDKFHYEFGRNETLVHVPAPHNQRGDIEYFYAYAHLKNGGFTFQVMHVSEIEKIRNDHSMAYQGAQKYNNTANAVWVKHYEAMACKTVIKKLIKYLPISVETQNAIAHDETIRRDITADATRVEDEQDGTENIQDFKTEILDKQEENAG
jgi:recombination protein RecT